MGGLSLPMMNAESELAKLRQMLAEPVAPPLYLPQRPLPASPTRTSPTSPGSVPFRSAPTSAFSEPLVHLSSSTPRTDDVASTVFNSPGAQGATQAVARPPDLASALFNSLDVN